MDPKSCTRGATAEELQRRLEIHLGDLKDPVDSSPWRLESSSIGGRGVFATRDIAVNEIIFRDCPLIIGPRSAKVDFPSCVVCHTRLTKLDVCKKGCGLSVCPVEKCQESVAHHAECELICSWEPKNPDEVSMTTLRSLTTIRGLLLVDNDKDLIEMLQGNPSPQIFGEIEMMVAQMKNFPKNLKVPLYHICAVLNTNAFETKLTKEVNVEDESLRGLYPLSCMMNHQCLPNVRYNFDDRQIMIVQAAREIKEGEEIFTSYLQLLWSTLTRRLQLKATKDFMCACPRCVDPTENGSYISAIKCAKPDCSTGRLLPVNPLVISSPWQCDACALKLEFKKISRIQDVLSSVIIKLKDKELKNMQEFLKNTVPDILPVNNEFALELKLFVIWRVGKENSAKGEFVDEDYREKEQYCLDILALLETMGAGECTIKGLIQFELYQSRQALKESTDVKNDTHREREDSEQRELLKNCWLILKDSVIAPEQLKRLCNQLDNNGDRLEQQT